MNGHMKPADIEKRSMEIITSELPHPIAEENADVIKRVIHTSADFDYADTLCFSPDVCAKTAALLQQGGGAGERGARWVLGEEDRQQIVLLGEREKRQLRPAAVQVPVTGSGEGETPVRKSGAGPPGCSPSSSAAAPLQAAVLPSRTSKAGKGACSREKGENDTLSIGRAHLH